MRKENDIKFELIEDRIIEELFFGYKSNKERLQMLGIDKIDFDKVVKHIKILDNSTLKTLEDKYYNLCNKENIIYEESELYGCCFNMIVDERIHRMSNRIG